MDIDPEDLFIHVEEWSRLIRQAIDGDKSSIDMVNHYILVTLLFAVVQGLMIPPVLDRSPSMLQGAAAVFAFLGFSLDVGGTFPGVFYLAILHARRHTYTTLFNDLAQFKDDFKIVVRSSRPKDLLDPNEQDGDLPTGSGQSQAVQGHQSIFSNSNITVTGGHFAIIPPRVQDSDIKQRLQRGVRFLGHLKTYPFVRGEDKGIIDHILELFRVFNISNAPQDIAQDDVPQAETIPNIQNSPDATTQPGSSQGTELPPRNGDGYPESFQSTQIRELPNSSSPPDVAVVFFKLFLGTTCLGGFCLGFSMISLLLSFERTFESCLAVVCSCIFIFVVFLPVIWQEFAFPQFLPSQNRLNVLEST